ncbi:predicted protein [Arabidopsis lyrata subsp. lyrata]|uniref:Predicted protein n=1 Tax=Arabidopsis lyrata subsp. lyrata TaxID=81972 RepID=D7KRT1_ARALL|nr:predicted protein [Arabidopsis lyrata subsp. lyrata]
MWPSGDLTIARLRGIDPWPRPTGQLLHKWQPLDQEHLVNRSQVVRDLIECCDGKSNPIRFSLLTSDEIRKDTNNYSRFWIRFSLQMVFRQEREPSHDTHQERCLLVDWLERISFVPRHSTDSSFINVMVYHRVQKLDIRDETWKRRPKIAQDIATA